MNANETSLVRELGGGNIAFSPPNLSLFNIVALVVLLGTTLARAFGFDLAAAMPTALACGAILVFGLPHGALDLELLKADPSGHSVPRSALLGAYLFCAGAMYLLWCGHPLFALAVFLCVAVVHFAEDWAGCRSPVLAIGLALATLAAPLMNHRADINILFTALSGDPSAPMLVDGMLLIAPVALLVGGVACLDLLKNGQAPTAIAGCITLGAMLTLPPVIAFAIYFCLLHSPAHLRENVLALVRGADGAHRAWPIAAITVGMTVAAMGLTALIFIGLPQSVETMPFFRATFMILSILTVPHMVMPHLVAWATSAGRTAPTGSAQVLSRSASVAS